MFIRQTFLVRRLVPNRPEKHALALRAPRLADEGKVEKGPFVSKIMQILDNVAV